MNPSPSGGADVGHGSDEGGRSVQTVTRTIGGHNPQSVSVDPRESAWSKWDQTRRVRFLEMYGAELVSIRGGGPKDKGLGNDERKRAHKAAATSRYSKNPGAGGGGPSGPPMPPDPLEPCEPEEEEETTPATVKLHLARQEFGTPKVRAELSSLLDLEAKTTTIKHQLAIADAVHVRKIDDALETLEMQRLLRLEKGGMTARSIEISEAEHERKKRAIKLVSEEDERRALEKAHAHRLHMQTLTQFEANHRAELAYKGSSLGRKGEGRGSTWRKPCSSLNS